jgi:tellurite resistance protein TerC
MDAPTPAAAPPRARDLAIALLSVGVGLGFAGLVWAWKGSGPAQQYVAGYLIELSLSVDNVFVFALVFAQFSLGPGRQRVLLFWGIAGAVVLRTAFILAGLGAIARFSWLIPAFGALILVTGVRLAAAKGGRSGPKPSGRAFSFATRHLPAGLAALAVLETVDLVFALDSIPAVLAVTHDATIAISSNLFAILGLRSLYFVVAGAIHTLRFLNAGLAAVLSFVGVKMLVEPWFAIPSWVALAVIISLVGAATAASLLFPAPKAARP